MIKFYRWGFSWRNRRAPVRDSLSDIFYRTSFGDGLPAEMETFWIAAHTRIDGSMRARVVASYCELTKCCYIGDVIVFDLHDRGKGLAKELLRQAMATGKSELVAPVSVAEDAVQFWTYLALAKSIPVRLGLVPFEISAIASQLRKLR